MAKGAGSFTSDKNKDTIDPKILARWTSKNQDERTVYVFGGLSFFFTLLGLLLILFGTTTNHYSVKYSSHDGCGSGKSCTVTLTLEKELKAPVYFFLGVENLYQNNRIYSESKNVDQLKGEPIGVGGLGSCGEMTTNGHAGLAGKTPASGTGTLAAKDPMIPCGWVAYTMPTETFVFTNKASGATIDVVKDDIAWYIDRKTYKNVDLDKQWIDMEDERFMNWMKIAGINEFKKLWGVINEDLPAGDYSIVVDASSPKTDFVYEDFNIEKSIHFSTLNRLGGQNMLIAICYLVAAAFSWGIFAIFMCRKIRNQRKVR